MEKFKVSDSKLNTLWNCEQKYVYNYINKLVPRSREIYLPVGAVYHVGASVVLHPMNVATDRRTRKEMAMEATLRASLEYDIPEEAQQVANWVGVYSDWVQPFLDNYQILSVEQWTETEIFNVEGVPVYGIAKSDAIAVGKTNSKLWVVEHKTTKSRPTGAREKQWTDGSQIAQYASILRDLLKKEVYGVKFHFMLKQKKPSVIEISGMIDENKLRRWKTSAEQSVRRMLELESGAAPIQCLSSCNSIYGECKYKLACNFGMDEPTVASLFEPKKELNVMEGIKT